MKDRGVYRGVFSALPDDPDFQRLPANARLAFYTVRICKQAGPAVIFRYYPALVAAQSGLTLRAVEAALQELERGLWIAREQVIVWVRNGLRYDPYMNLSNEKQRKGVIKSLAELPRLEIVLRFCDYYDLPYPFDRASIGLPSFAPPIPDIRVPIPDIRVPNSAPEDPSERTDSSSPDEQEKKPDKHQPRELVDQHAKLFQAKTGQAMLVSYPRDCKRVKPIIDAHGIENALDLDRHFFSSDAGWWVRKNAWNLGVFVSAVNDLVAANGRPDARRINDKWAGRPGGETKL